ncbi:MAG: SBBP repeat-containing protein, partial [Candidatus Aminicenantes bacterium]
GDYGWGIDVDGSGNAYVTGSTGSTDFPTLNQYQTYQGYYDVFVTKISAFSAAAPTVDTPTSAAVTYTTATLGGNVADTGGANVTERGVYWSTTNGFTPPGQGTKVSETGNWGTGTFTVNVTGLPAGITIYFKAFATNTAGTGYSAQDSFTTPAITAPTVTTTAVSNITTTSADSGGNVTYDGGSAVTARGVCWSTNVNPTTADNTTTDGTGTGSFTSSITGLMEYTTYYVRAYATNSVGTGYGKQRSFTTKAESVTVTITEPQDGAHVSGTVIIKATTSSNPAKVSDASIQAVEKVEFYCDETKIAEDTGEPYETTWDTTTYADGSHNIKAVAYNIVNQTAEDEITVHVGNTPPEIMLNRTHLNYGSVPQAGTASLSLNAANLTTGSQTILINNIGGGTLNWIVSEDANWLTCTPESGTGKGAVTVTTDPSGLQTGTYNATITIQDPNAVNSPQTVTVVLVVYDPGTTTIPFGYFESPIDGSTVMSSIPVTGWALDDIDITSVKIYRAPIPGHETGSLVYIGDAVMVDGARPDVEQQFPTYPKDYQAGWGYMMLTNFLPNQGNGTFTLYAKATDKEGNEVTLGSKTITCDNANAVKPFGAIDTPGQGGTASGSAYVNFGWALTPQPNTIPTDGSTINVWVDGVRLGSPVYNQYREDIASLFPGYNNSNGAVGYFYLDTTAYLNGVHTIAWSAQDNAGNQDGIGSRYFTIVNIGRNGIAGTKSDDNHLIRPHYFSVSHVHQATLSVEPVLVKKGYDRNAGFEVLYPDPEGIISIQLREDQRVEIVLRNSLFSEAAVVSGYMITGDRLQLLPIGSTLDNGSGIFYWQPCAGFFGHYRFVFVEKSADGQLTKKLVNVVISTKY